MTALAASRSRRPHLPTSRIGGAGNGLRRLRGDPRRGCPHSGIRPRNRRRGKVENGKLAVEQIRAAPGGCRRAGYRDAGDGRPDRPAPASARRSRGSRVIMASTLTTRGAEIALRALRLGASDYVPKPSTIGTVQRRRLQAGTAGEGQRPRAACAAGPSPRRVRRGADRVAPGTADSRPACWLSAVRPAARRRCSPWFRAWDGRSACQW